MDKILATSDFFDLKRLYQGTLFPDNVLTLLGKNLTSWLETLLDQHDVGDEPVILGDCHNSAVVTGRVLIEKGAVIEPGAYIKGPAFIGAGSEVRHCAYIRGNVYVGKNCVVGHTTEVKGACFMDGAKAGHFAYVGDSVLGMNTNLGAGTKIANLKIKNDEVSYKDPVSGKKTASGMRKFGAVLGDRAQTGCNAVLSPGTLLLPDTAVLPAQHFHGTLKSGWSSRR